MSLPFGRQPSKEATSESSKSIKSSFTEGSSKIFGSVKKGFFEGISSTFDQVANIVSTNEDGSTNPQNAQNDQPDQQQTDSQNTQKDNSQNTDGKRATSKPKPPKPPAPISRQKSEQGSNNSLNKASKDQQKKPQHQQHQHQQQHQKQQQDGAPSRPFLVRRNTNPFMEDYEPSVSDHDLPSTVVAEVYQMVSALYSDDEKRDLKPGSEDRRGRRDDGDSEGTEGCDDVADLEEVEEGAREGVGKDPVARECEEFMQEFVAKVFDSNAEITPAYKSKFCELSQKGFGRLNFAEFITKRKTSDQTKIADETFYALIQFFTIVLFECNESEDYAPAKSLMNACFVFYCETDASKGAVQKQLLYSFLKDLPIWHSPKFWNAAFFFALQHERAGNNEATDQETNALSYKQLLSTTYSMRMLGLSKEQCIEYIKRQASTAGLNQEQVNGLKERMERWVEGADNTETTGAIWFISQKAKAVSSAARLLKDGFSFKGALKGDN